MSDNAEDKSKSPFDSETEDKTIALSKHELDDILSEAEIVQETANADENIKPEEDVIESTEASGEEAKVHEESAEMETEPISEFTEGDEFDISREIDELSPEDLENIELEEGDIENHTKELEYELGEGKELEIPMMDEKEAETEEDLKAAEEELSDIDIEGMDLEPTLDEEMDLDTYLDSVKSDIDLEAADTGEEEEIEEAPVTEEMEEPEGIEKGEEEEFREAGIEGIEDELEAAGTEMGDDELLKGLEEVELAPKEEVVLSEEEEQILSEDLDLSAEEAEKEEVVTVTGEELGKITEEEAILPGPVQLEKEVEEEGVKEAETLKASATAIDQTLFNDITVILKYMDNLLGELPEEKIKEFSKSKYFSLYKEVFEKLNLT